MSGILNIERISSPGFLRGLRAVGIPGTDINHKYFMMYEAETKKFLHPENI